MPRRKLIISGVNKGKYVLIRKPGERIYCEEPGCGKVAMAKYPGGRWLCRYHGFHSPEGRKAIGLINKRIRGR